MVTGPSGTVVVSQLTPIPQLVVGRHGGVTVPTTIPSALNSNLDSPPWPSLAKALSPFVPRTLVPPGSVRSTTGSPTFSKFAMTFLSPFMRTVQIEGTVASGAQPVQE